MCWKLLFVTLALGSESDAAQPRFEDYPINDVYRGKRIPPNVKSDLRDYPGYRAVLGDSQKPTNFGGHYVISKDTCGSDSVRLMITDARTGHVFDRIPCFFWDYTVGPKARTDLPWGVEYRADSSLLVAHGCFDADDPECGDHYYKMTNRGLVSIEWVPFNPPVRPSN
jgi:hypothetical protein